MHSVDGGGAEEFTPPDDRAVDTGHVDEVGEYLYDLAYLLWRPGAVFSARVLFRVDVPCGGPGMIAESGVHSPDGPIGPRPIIDGIAGGGDRLHLIVNPVEQISGNDGDVSVCRPPGSAS